jgi:hypothetical protein
MVQGLTALALTRHTPVAGKSVLVNAAAGGVGTLLIELLKRAGAHQVIAAASTEAKRQYALGLGADAAVDYTADGWTERVREITTGAGPDVVFESVGGSVTMDSLSVLGPRGVIVVYGALNIQSFSLGIPELLQLIFKNQAVLGFAVAPLLTPQALHDDLKLLFELAMRAEDSRGGGPSPVLSGRGRRSHVDHGRRGSAEGATALGRQGRPMKRPMRSTERAAMLCLLVRLREAAGINQTTLAARLRITQSQVSKFERGERTLDVLRLRAWLLALGIEWTPFADALDQELGRLDVLID